MITEELIPLYESIESKSKRLINIIEIEHKTTYFFETVNKNATII